MKIDWKAHLVELAVVFVGITLAFMLEGWRDAGKQADLEQKYFQSFQYELGIDQSKLDSLVDHNEARRADIARLRDMLTGETAVDPDTVTALFAGAMMYAQLPQNGSTYVSITGSGNLNVVSDYALRQAIVEYYQLLASSELETEVCNRYVDNYVVPLFIEHLDFVTTKWSPPEIVQTPRFRNLVMGYLQLQTQSLDAYRKIQMKRDALADLVDRALVSP